VPRRAVGVCVPAWHVGRARFWGVSANSTPDVRPLTVQLLSRSFIADYWMVVRNEHIMLSVALGHPKFPLRTSERLAVLLSTIFFAYGAGSTAHQIRNLTHTSSPPKLPPALPLPHAEASALPPCPSHGASYVAGVASIAVFIWDAVMDACEDCRTAVESVLNQTSTEVTEAPDRLGFDGKDVIMIFISTIIQMTYDTVLRSTSRCECAREMDDTKRALSENQTRVVLQQRAEAGTGGDPNAR
jgi:hypothetical protein